MNFNDAVRKLRAISFALNRIEVKGRENMDALLGSIQTVEQVADQLELFLSQTEVTPVPNEETPAE